MDKRPRIGTLSIHLDGKRCGEACPYCYLGQRSDAAGPPIDAGAVGRLLAGIDCDEVAIAVSHGTPEEVLQIEALAALARPRRLSLTTTEKVLQRAPGLARIADRVGLSVDPAKGDASPTAVAGTVARVRGAMREGAELILLATLTDAEHAARLREGWLAGYLALPVDGVALNGLKPPPAWCDRAFWLRLCAGIGPLLGRELGRRLFLDCHVAARILGISDCPGRADLSPGMAFRGCVYQAAPDLRFAREDALLAHLEGWKPPSVCPFEIG